MACVSETTIVSGRTGALIGPEHLVSLSTVREESDCASGLDQRGPFTSPLCEQRAAQRVNKKLRCMNVTDSVEGYDSSHRP